MNAEANLCNAIAAKELFKLIVATEYAKFTQTLSDCGVDKSDIDGEAFFDHFNDAVSDAVGSAMASLVRIAEDEERDQGSRDVLSDRADYFSRVA